MKRVHHVGGPGKAVRRASSSRRPDADHTPGHAGAIRRG
ncbi:hypothetical protein BSLA_01f3348 [Burkholderia stabilis]|nr:hypothetical protein BSLA_01f3348 [Burkholderia stabilis]